MSSQNSIGVIVLEPNGTLLRKLCDMAAQVWGTSEVLPRQTCHELRVAAKNLDVGLVVVRASVQRSCPMIRKYLVKLAEHGTRFMIIQDTAHSFTYQFSVNMGALSFIDSQASEDKFKEVLLGCKVGHYLNDRFQAWDQQSSKAKDY